MADVRSKHVNDTPTCITGVHVCHCVVRVTVFGCVDLLLTDDKAVVTRLGDTAVIRCSDPDDVFVLTCIRGQWIGTQQSNCSTGSLVCAVVVVS